MDGSLREGIRPDDGLFAARPDADGVDRDVEFVGYVGEVRSRRFGDRLPALIGDARPVDVGPAVEGLEVRLAAAPLFGRRRHKVALLGVAVECRHRVGVADANLLESGEGVYVVDDESGEAARSRGV